MKNLNRTHVWGISCRLIHFGSPTTWSCELVNSYCMPRSKGCAPVLNNNFSFEFQLVTPGDKWLDGKLQFMLSQRGKPLLVHDGFTFGIQYIRKDKKYWQCNLSRKYNCKARVTTTESGDIIVTNNEHCHTEIRQHLRKDYKMNRLHLSQNLYHQHALQMNLNRLSQAQQQAIHLSNHIIANSGSNNNGSNYLKVEEQETISSNNNNNVNHDQERNNNNQNGRDHREEDLAKKAEPVNTGANEELPPKRD